MRVPERTGRINQLEHPEMLLRQRNAGTSALAKILHLTYDEEMPPRLADEIRRIIVRRDVAGASTREQEER